jgi:hypothetical protein
MQGLPLLLLVLVLVMVMVLVAQFSLQFSSFPW